MTSIVRYPQSNGESERAVQTVKAMLRKAIYPYISMLAYRSTPLRNGFSPSELMLGRKLRTSLPVIPTKLVLQWPDFDLVFFFFFRLSEFFFYPLLGCARFRGKC